jgi:hypothetical protein
MTRLRYTTLLLILFCLGACKNFDDASPIDNISFVKFYHGPYNFTGVEVESIPEGYAILGNITIASDSTAAFIIRTDKKGNQIGSTSFYPGNIAKAFEPVYSNGEVAAYLIVGDSVKLDPAASKAGNTEIYSAKLLKVDPTGSNVLVEKRQTDLEADSAAVKIDFKSSSITVSLEGEIILLGTYKEDNGSPEKPFILSLNNDLTPKWFKQYNLLQRNYVNGRSVHYNNGEIIWASAILKPSGDFNDSYLAIPYVQEKSTFENFSQLGETSSQLLLATDIQPARVAQLGYGVIGTRGLTDGSNANMLFVRVDESGNFIPNSEKYFDASIMARNEETTATTSESQDQGDAITSTQDGGFVLAGSTQSGTDTRNIFLVKVNSVGIKEWSKVLGGDGDETVCSIREEADGSLVICGTNNLSGLSSIFLIRTDKNGELKN